MQVTLKKVQNYLSSNTINLLNGDNDKLTNNLFRLIQLSDISWSYVFETDTLIIDLPDGSTIPDLSMIGEVQPDAPI